MRNNQALLGSKKSHNKQTSKKNKPEFVADPQPAQPFRSSSDLRIHHPDKSKIDQFPKPIKYNKSILTSYLNTQTHANLSQKGQNQILYHTPGAVQLKDHETR